MEMISLTGAVPCEKCGRPRNRSTSNRNYGQLRTCTYCRQNIWRDANREKISADNKARYEADRDAAIKRADDWRTKNLEKHRVSVRKAKLKRLCSTPDYYDAKLKEQNYACAICGKPMAERRLDQDHDHQRKKPRGLLCNLCNTQLGQYEKIKPKIPVFEAYLLQYENLSD